MNNFTPRAERVLALARKIADELKNGCVDVEHIALGMLRLHEGVHTEVWRRLNFNDEKFDRELQEIIAKKTLPPPPTKGNNIPYTPEVKKLLALAGKEAKALNHSYVGTEHYLLAIFRLGTEVSQLLNTQGLTRDIALGEILKELDELDPNFEDTGSSQGTEVRVPENPLALDQVGFQVLIDPGDAEIDDVIELLDAISELNRAVGGQGVIFLDSMDESRILHGEAA